ncbi:hypothetical protein VTH06DRAFT_317 [Thermothelomyces fergusii]
MALSSNTERETAYNKPSPMKPANFGAIWSVEVYRYPSIGPSSRATSVTFVCWKRQGAPARQGRETLSGTPRRRTKISWRDGSKGRGEMQAGL